MAFSYEHLSSLLDSAYHPSSPIVTPLIPQPPGDQTLNNTYCCFPYYYSCETIAEVSGTDAKACDSNSSLESATDAPSADSSTGNSPKLGEDDKNNSSKQQVSVEKKRKSKDESSRFMSGRSKITKGVKSCKHETTMVEPEEREIKKAKDVDLKPSEEPPSGYIHVRARRGQATDRHSLAERVRRERISERMKMLQGLVPGCEKVSGKARMLDEIINYVQSLQNQVEFLSMGLASLSPVVYGFGLDISDHTAINPPEKMRTRTLNDRAKSSTRLHNFWERCKYY